MRTLKKTLSLVLALVLCFGLVGTAFAANVDAYTDGESVGAAYAEAAEVMIGLGIIKGMSDTELGANGTLTREQAAKIVAYLALGKTVADAQSAAAAPFKDVAADRWSAGYIAYCADKGILAGYGDGNFGPADELTGLQFAKMILAALGYGKGGEFTPESWGINSSLLGFQLNLFKGDAAAATHSPITRQQAMLMAFNARALVQKNFDKDVEDYVNKDGAPVLPGFKGLDDVTGQVDAYGRPTTDWYNDVDGDGNEVTELIASVVKAPAKTYMTFGAAEYAALAAQGYTFTGTEFVVNGGAIPGVSTIADFYGRGYTGNAIELYATNPAAPKNITKVVMVQEYLTKVTNIVSSYTTATSNYITLAVYNPWHASDVVNVTFNDSAVAAIPSIYDELVAKYARGDYFMTAWAYGDVVADAYHWLGATDVTTEVANVTSTKLDAAFSGTFVAGGKTYTMASGYAEYTGIGGALTLGKDHTFYIDANGYVVGAALVNPTVAAVNYGVVLNYAYANGTPASNMTGAPAAAAYEKVQIFTAAGAPVIYETAFAKNAATEAITTYVAKAALDTATENIAGTNLDNDKKGLLVEYTLDANGKIATLTAATATGGLADHTKGNTFAVDSANATDKTVVFVMKSTITNPMTDIAVYTGYASVPTATYTAGKALAANAAYGKAGAVSATIATLPDSTTLAQYIVLLGAPSVSAGAKTGEVRWTYDAILDGAATTVFAEGTTSALEGIFDVSTGVLAEVTFNAATGAVATLDAATPTINQITVVNAGYYQDDAIVYTNDKTVYYKLSGVFTDGGVTAITGFAAADGITMPGAGDTFKVYEYETAGTGTSASPIKVVFYFVYQG